MSTALTTTTFVLCLIVANAWFVLAEYALITAKRHTLEEKARAGSHGARSALKLTENPVKLIGTIQVYITGLGILLGAIGEPLLRDILNPVLATGVAFIIALLIITYLSVAFGELIPKTIALHHSERISILIAPTLHILERISHPFVWVLQQSATVVLKALRIPNQHPADTVKTMEELRGIVRDAEDEGVIAETEEELLYNVFDFASKEARDIMVPRSKMVALPLTASVAETFQQALEAPYTRFPAYHDKLDRIQGLLHLKDLAYASEHTPQTELDQILRAVIFVPETKDVSALLAEMRRDNRHMAIVLDEYGNTAGIVTLEDILEEIVGEIEDEFDLPDESVEPIDSNTLRVHGSYTIDDFNERFLLELPTEHSHTLAGLVFDQLGRKPTAGDTAEIGLIHFQVEKVDGQRIVTLVVKSQLPITERQLKKPTK